MNRAGGAIAPELAADYLSTRQLATLLGRRDLARLRERLRALRVPFKGSRWRPRWDVERARLLLGH